MDGRVAGRAVRRPRQREAVAKYARAAGYEIIAEYSDDGVKSADPVDQRPGFAAMMKHIAGNGVRTIIVETASRFARDLIVQETGWRFLKDGGIRKPLRKIGVILLHDVEYRFLGEPAMVLSWCAT